MNTANQPRQPTPGVRPRCIFTPSARATHAERYLERPESYCFAKVP